ncbi:Hypothetical predicted protein, partial [Paramuricea clavata]
GLLEQINEMIYANHQNAFVREACAVIQKNIEAHGLQMEACHVQDYEARLYAMQGDGLVNVPLQAEVPHLQAPPHPHAPEHLQALLQEGAAAPPHAHAQQPAVQPPLHPQAQQPAVQPPLHPQAQQPAVQPPLHPPAHILLPTQQIGIPNPVAGGQRRPYHAIACENAQALNTFLTLYRPTPRAHTVRLQWETSNAHDAKGGVWLRIFKLLYSALRVFNVLRIPC